MNSPTHPKRIDLIITELEVGGAERCLVELAIYLHRHDWKVRVISIASPPVARPTRLQATQLVDRLTAAGVAIEFLNVNHSRFIYRALTAYRKLLKQDPPAVIQSFLFHANMLATIANRRRQTPIFGGVRVADPSRWRAMMQRWASRAMRKLVCVSDDVAKHCADFEKINPDKLIVIPNGITIGSQNEQLSHETLARHQLTLQDKLLLFVGRLTKQKGVDWLVEFADDFLDQLPEHRLVILGEGILEESLRSKVETLKHRSQVRMIGWQPNVRSWLAQSELLLLPARYEGMPNVVLEAMAEGRAVVASHAHGIEDLLGDQAEIQQVQFGDERAWLEKIVEFSKNADLRQKIGECNLTRARERYELEELLAQYENLYLNSLNS